MKRIYSLSLEEDVVRQSKAIAGLVPFSRYVEDLLRKSNDIKKEHRGSQGQRGAPIVEETANVRT
jgi:hypothetical protein